MEKSNISAADINKGIVQKYYLSYFKRDINGIKSVLADDVEWIIPGHNPLSGIKKGADEIIAFFDQMEKINFKGEMLIVEGNENYVINCHRGWGEFEGETIDMNWVLLFKIENGKIQRVEHFAGDQHKADAFFWHVYRLKPIPERLAE